MGAPDPPDPVVRAPDGPLVDAAALAEELRERVDGEGRFDAGSRAAHSTDASNFRQTPIGVVLPRTPEAAAEPSRWRGSTKRPCCPGAAGPRWPGSAPTRPWCSTGQSTATGWSRWTRTPVPAWCSPASSWTSSTGGPAPTGLRFGPEPATHANCTIDGMSGNNACGATAQAHGKVVDNISRLEVLLYDGTRFWCGKTNDEEYAVIERRGDPRAAVYRRLRALRDTHAELPGGHAF